MNIAFKHRLFFDQNSYKMKPYLPLIKAVVIIMILTTIMAFVRIGQMQKIAAINNQPYVNGRPIGSSRPQPIV